MLTFAAFVLQMASASPEWVAVSLPDGGELRYLRVTAGDADYPPAAKRALSEGTSVLTLTIAVDGTISSCNVYRSSGRTDLDQKACQLFRERGQFRLSGRTRPVTVRAPLQWVLVD